MGKEPKEFYDSATPTLCQGAAKQKKQCSAGLGSEFHSTLQDLKIHHSATGHEGRHSRHSQKSNSGIPGTSSKEVTI